MRSESRVPPTGTYTCTFTERSFSFRNSSVFEDLVPGRSPPNRYEQTKHKLLAPVSAGWWPVARARDCASGFVSARTRARCAPLWCGCFAPWTGRVVGY